MAQVILEEVFSPGCHTCKELEAFWESIKGDFPNVRFDRIDVTTDKGLELAQKHMILASPGIVLNGELFSTGGFNKDKLITKLRQLMTNN